jgi:tetratricopeptide (TPR) repeat protein
LKKWKPIAGRIALLLLGPIVFFGLLEAGLRLGGYGDPVTFFRPVEVDGRTFTVENPYFGQRFFRRHLPRVPAWNLIPPPTPGVARIAVIGESAAQGYPLQKIGLASILEGILEIEYPGRRFDFINAAMTSVNSHVLADIVPEVIAQQPDVAVLYMGNNEVVGPYGPGTPFTAWLRHPAMVWLDMNLRRTKVFQLLEKSVMGATAAAPNLSWDGFQMFSQLTVPADSLALQNVYASFERNLEFMVDALLADGTRVILCTVAVNLADWGPAASSPLPEDSPARPLLKEGESLLSEGRPAEALLALEKATALAPDHAAAHFLLGRARQATGDNEAARASFERARDLDLYRFRADTEINEIIRRIAARHADRGVTLVDADRALVADGLPGQEQFTEHVHMTFDGMKRLGLLVAQALPPMLPNLGSPRAFTAADEAELRERIFFTPFDELLLSVVARDVGEIDIFEDRPRAGETRDHWSALEKNLRASHPFDVAQLEAAFARAQALRPDDPGNAASRADYLSRLGRTAEAATVGQSVLARKPTYFEGYRFMADAAKEQGDFIRARALYGRALDIYRLIPDAQKNVGDLERREGDIEAARAAYTRAFTLDAANVGAALALAEIQANSGRRDEARQTLENAASHNPRDAFIFQALGRLHAAEGRPAEARTDFAKALELDPSLSPRELLRLASESLGAAEQKAVFATYEKRFGEEHDLYNNFAWLLATAPDASVRDPEAALRLACRAIELSPGPNPFYHGTLAAAAAAQGDFASAQSNVQRALELAADNPQLVEQLSRMQQRFAARQAYFEVPGSAPKSGTPRDQAPWRHGE